MSQTEADTKTLNIVETLIKAEFKDGLPPHLQQDARSLSYKPGSTQSRIFVCSEPELKAMDDSQIQAILRNRIILSHGHTFDYNYQWDLRSFGRLHDVDRKITVQGEIGSIFAKSLWLKIMLSRHVHGSGQPWTSSPLRNAERNAQACAGSR